MSNQASTEFDHNIRRRLGAQRPSTTPTGDALLAKRQRKGVRDRAYSHTRHEVLQGHLREETTDTTTSRTARIYRKSTTRAFGSTPSRRSIPELQPYRRRCPQRLRAVQEGAHLRPRCAHIRGVARSIKRGTAIDMRRSTSSEPHAHERRACGFTHTCRTRMRAHGMHHDRARSPPRRCTHRHNTART